MISRVTIAAVLMAAICITSAGQDGKKPEKAPAPAAGKAKDAQRVIAALREPVTMDNLDKITFHEMIARLNKQTSVPILINTLLPLTPADMQGARLDKKDRAAITVTIQERMRSILDNETVSFDNLENTPLSELKTSIEKQFQIPIIINTKAFAADMVRAIADQKPSIGTNTIRGMKLGKFLDLALNSMSATFIVRPDYVEITTLRARLEDKVTRVFPIVDLVIPIHTTAAQADDNKLWFKSGVTSVRDMKLASFLKITLGSIGATYLVRNDYIEIMNRDVAAFETGSKRAHFESGNDSSGDDAPLIAQNMMPLEEILISGIFHDKSLNEAVAVLADDFDLSVVVSPQCGDKRTMSVTAKLLNLPADKALDLLVSQADLRVVRKGKGFLITTKEQATEMTDEAHEKERKKIELHRLRIAPFAPNGARLPGLAPGM